MWCLWTQHDLPLKSSLGFVKVQGCGTLLTFCDFCKYVLSSPAAPSVFCMSSNGFTCFLRRTVTFPGWCTTDYWPGYRVDGRCGAERSALVAYFSTGVMSWVASLPASASLGGLRGLPWPDNALSWCHSWLAGAAQPGMRWCNACRSRWPIELSNNLGAISAGLRLSEQSIGTELMPVRIFWKESGLVWPGFCITHWHHFCQKINEMIRATWSGSHPFCARRKNPLTIDDPDLSRRDQWEL